MPSDDATDEGGHEVVLPPAAPPKTSAPATFQTQVNVTNIPPNVWEKLPPDQIVEVSKAALAQIEATDKRNFNFAMDRAEKESKSERRVQVIGGFLAFVGFLCVAFLSSGDHEVVAGILATFLATILAVVAGSRLGFGG